MTTDPFTEAARAEAERRHVPRDRPTAITEQCAVQGFQDGAEWARTHLAAQEPSVLMTSCEETISDRLSDAGYTEYAEDEDGGLTWVSAPLGEVLCIVSAVTETASRTVRSWRAMYRVAEEERDKALAALEAEPTDAEVLAALNAQSRGLVGAHATQRDSLDRFESQSVAAMRAALSAARAARRDEEKRDD